MSISAAVFTVSLLVFVLENLRDCIFEAPECEPDPELPELMESLIYCEFLLFASLRCLEELEEFELEYE